MSELPQDLVMEIFLSNPTRRSYIMVKDRRLARSLLNRDDAKALYFLYDIGYLTNAVEVVKAAIRDDRMDLVRKLLPDCEEERLYELIYVAAEAGNEPLTYELIGRSQVELIPHSIAVEGASKGGHHELAEHIGLLPVEKMYPEYDHEFTDGKVEGGFIEGIPIEKIEPVCVVRSGNLELLKSLPDVNWQDVAEVAATIGNLDIVRYALTKDIDVGDVFNDAVEKYRMDIIYYIELNYPDSIDWGRAYNYALASGFKDMVEYVEEHQ